MHYLLVSLLVLYAQLGWAETVIVDASCGDKYAAKLVSLQGKFLVDPKRNGHWQPARLQQLICEGSGIKVEANSRASLRLSNGIVLRLHGGTNATLDAIAPEQATFLHLLKGFVHFISRTPRLLKISTPIANAGPEGTEFAIRVDDAQASLWVYEGAVKFYNDKGSVKLKPGEGAQARLGLAPQARVDIQPQDAVSWALYYPPVLPYPKASDPVDNGLRAAIQEYRQGHIDEALARLDGVPTAKQDPYFHKARAALRLSAGQDQRALQDIQAVLGQKPNDADALALQSVRELTQNRKDQALALANKAIAANPQSASAYSALSYAEQGRFQLDKAQAAADRAAKLAPHDAFVWARKAELELSQGLASESRQAAKKAAELDPSLERTQTVMGFSQLLHMDTDEALQSFEQAVRLDSTAPLPRLGLGLAKIRSGDLEQGREDLETAAILDPNNAIVRSYLGKAYYEERRSALAEDQFKLAKDRDPKDPTPYFYDAINKQTTNRPVEALEDMEKAIELNDNRAVYRSKLALDEDLAARSSSLSRVYRDLGYSQLALVEGWKSVNAEPSDYSGHRLLADSYSTRPLYEIARVSELLQSQLLQPINVTPIQPQLAEKNLLTLEGAGPAVASFNEFNPLFTRDRFTLQTSGVVGSNDTYGDEVVHSGLWRNLSYSIGQYHYETDGFRLNNDVQVDLVTGFIQANITPKLSIQAEIRHKETERGDIDLTADGSFAPDFRIASDRNTYRAGMHYSFEQGSDLIASFIHLEGTNFSEQPLVENFGTLDNIYGNQGEIQHLLRTEYFSAVSGFGFAQSGFAPADEPDNETVSSHANGYLYTYTHYPHDFDWTLGFSVDSFESDSPTIRQFNPKAGMIWRPKKGTTLRWAVSRTLKRSLITNQTIEPTQVAGFNQFFDDYTRTNAWLYGVAVDQKFSPTLFGGLEFYARDLSQPRPRGEEGKRLWEERSYRAYMNWNITSRLSSSLSFQLEEFEGDKNFSTSLVPLSTTTYDGKAALRYFDPIGFFCNLEAEYVNQRTNWPDAFEDDPPFVKHNEFVLFNAGIGMRLPKRWGIVQLDIKNIFDRRFDYQSQGQRSSQNSGDGGQPPPFIPDRTITAKFTLAF